MRKILSILFILMLIITLVQIRSMYALYKDKLSGEYSTSLGKWNVKINGTDITSPGDIVTFDMTENCDSYGTSDYVFGEIGVIAPDTEAFFDILIDTHETDVAVLYEIEIGQSVEDELGNEFLGQVSSYRVRDLNTGEFLIDNTDDDVDNSLDDYEFEIPVPMKFEVLGVEDKFGDYSIDSDSNEIVGNESEEIISKKNGVNQEKNKVLGVIPLIVNQTNNMTDKVTVNFKFIII